MPKNKEGEVVCVNHPELQMVHHDKTLTLPGLIPTDRENDYNVEFDEGLTLNAYKCNECGYTELYTVELD